MTTSQGPTGLARRRTVVRRTIVSVLILVCLMAFTAYFRESSGGPMHSVQEASGAFIAPVQSVADRAVRPFQDGWNWVTGLVDARGDKARLEKEVAELRQQVVNQSGVAEENSRLKALLRIQGDAPDGYRVVNASIINRSPSSWFARARIDVGTSDGVVVNSPVVANGRPGASLVGVVTSASGSSAVVTFITDASIRIGAYVDGSQGGLGILRPTTGGQLLMEKVPREFEIKDGAPVRTAGFTADLRLPSIFPPGLAVGQVTGHGSREVDVYQTIQVSPWVDVRTLNAVSVLAPQSPAAKRRAAG